MSNQVTIDLDEWTRRAEIERIAEVWGVPVEEALRRLVNKALSL